jgi:murein DD-endopeptidase MepM/ murein hydrolase activator NlpD
LNQLERLCARVEGWFPERHLYVRQGGEMRAFVLSQRQQMIAAGGVAAAALWMGVCTAAMLLGLIQGSTTERQVAQTKAQTQAKYERWIADHEARNASAAGEHGGSPAALAALVERRHAALALLLVDAKTAPGAAQALTPPIAQAFAAATGAADPIHRLQAVQASQEQLLEAADTFAHDRAERVRMALRLAGVSPAGALRQQTSLRGPLGGQVGGPVGGPLIEGDDPRALAAILDVDPAFAQRIQSAAADLSDAQTLTEAAERLPLARPTQATAQTSGFGVRVDPFTHRSAFHPGLDFAGARMTPVHATAPGRVTFTGVRTGYGNTVEVDHGGGFKTRYAHLASIGVRPGQSVAAGARLGGMGSTGRSTGTHLHYEVWVNGRVQNPERFVRAGAYALQGG